MFSVNLTNEVDAFRCIRWGNYWEISNRLELLEDKVIHTDGNICSTDNVSFSSNIAIKISGQYRFSFWIYIGDNVK